MVLYGKPSTQHTFRFSQDDSGLSHTLPFEDNGSRQDEGQPERSRSSPRSTSSHEPLPHLDPDFIPEPGELLSGIYRVQRLLGAGAMGVTLLVRDEQLERDVAIKLLRRDRESDQDEQARLIEEARAMARIHHPNVVEVYSLGEHRGAQFLVMQYVPGMTLDAYVRARGGARLPLDVALSILDQACRGVSELHAAGLAHRDLKPQNILVDTGLRVVVADLGLALKFRPGDDPELTFAGTPTYLAPEVVLGCQTDPTLLPRVDVYALGLIAYLLLTGRLPFEGKSALDLFKQHAFKEPPCPSALCPELPPSFDAPLLEALAKDPEQRTESVEALREALIDARDGLALSRRSLRVLVADDNRHFRELVTRMIAIALPGANVVAVANGEAALADVREVAPALGVFDLHMPGLDGLALTAAVRALPARGEFPIIIMTGTGGAADWHRLSELGASAFLVKPFDVGQLITLARGLVGFVAHAGPVVPSKSAESTWDLDVAI
jgi:eukaryotic-like serine/threonine-protein kinase